MLRNFVRVETMPHHVGVLPNRVLPFIWYFVRQIKWQLILITTLFAVSNICFTLFPYGIKMILDGAGAPASPSGFWTSPFATGLIFFFLMVVGRSVLEAVAYNLCARTYSPFTMMIRRQIAQYVNNHSYRYFQDDFAGRIAGKVIETPRSVQGFVFSVLDQGFYLVMVYIGTAALLAHVDTAFFYVIVIWILCYVAILVIMIPRVKTATVSATKQMNILRGRFTDVVTNILQVKLFARREYEDKNILDQTRVGSHLFTRRDLIGSNMGAMIFLSLIVLFAVVIFMIATRYQAGTLSVGDISLLLSAMLMLYNNSLWASNMFSDLFQSYGEIYEGIDLITQAHEVVDHPNVPALNVTHGEIDIRDLVFTYPGRAVFNHLNIHIPAGQKVGLVGPSGAGKSTLVQLVLRLFDIDDGAILIDGQSIAEVQQETLRAQIGVIPQSSELLHRSVRENILYGRLDASDDDMIAAAKMAHAHDFILELRDKDGRTGYDAHVGERGVKLSGGQRQRISIARAILKDARVLLLDEATSALDSESEALVQDALFKMMAGRTVLAIAHRLSTIMHMDRLLVMRDGQIVEDGSHAELLARGGYYAALWARQAGGFIKA